MGLGGSIALIAIGLILGFAVTFQVAGIDVHLIGYILTAVGILGIVLWFMVWAPRRRAVTTTVRRDGYVDPRVAPAAGYVEERQVRDDGY
jgi:uncharacterized membrane protein YedE/YeeE